MAEHTDDLRNVQEGDELRIETTEGYRAEVTCVEYKTLPAGESARRAGIIRETTRWVFDHNGNTLVAEIVDGLRESPDMDKFPQYTPLTDIDSSDEPLGYIEELTLRGQTNAVEP